MYRDKNAVTLDQINTHIRTINIPTNPPNIIHDFRATAERDRGFRIKITVRSGKTINKYFHRLHKIIDFLDGNDFFPWLRSKSHVFVCFEDKNKIQSEGSLNEGTYNSQYCMLLSNSTVFNFPSIF